MAPLGQNGAKLAVPGGAAGLEEDCRLAAVVVSRVKRQPGCRDTAFVIDQQDVARHGAHALTTTAMTASGKPVFRVTAAYPDVRRPFMPPVPDQ